MMPSFPKSPNNLWPRLKKFAASWPGFALMLLLLHQGIRLGQAHLGRQAFDATGLPQYTLQEAKVIAAKNQRLIVAEFSAYWCSTCQAMDKELLSRPEIKHLLTEQYVYARIDESSPEADVLAPRYGVRGYPSLMLLNSQGELLKQLPLTLDAAQFVDNLRQSKLGAPTAE